MQTLKRIAIVTSEEGDQRCASALRRRLAPLAESLILITIQSLPVDADLFIEAAGFERQDQLMALRCISAIANDECIIATSSPILSISEIESSVTNPERLIGVVPAYPFGRGAIEILTGDATSETVVARISELVSRAGFRGRPILQWNGGPTLITRVFGQIAIEAWNLAIRTADPARIDRLCMNAGLPVGPLRVMDAIGVGNLAAMLGRSEELHGVERIYARSDRSQPDSVFRSICHSTDDSNEIESGFVIDAAGHAVGSALEEELVTDINEVLEAISSGLGVDPINFPRWVEQLHTNRVNP